MFQNPYNPMYPQRLMEAQRYNSPYSQPQLMSCLVNSKEDLQNIQTTPGVIYVGVNKQAKEVYIRSWNNNGLIDFETYSLSQGEQEATEMKTILDKLNNIEIKIKEMSDERNDANVNATSNAGSNAKPSDDGII